MRLQFGVEELRRPTKVFMEAYPEVVVCQEVKIRVRYNPSWPSLFTRRIRTESAWSRSGDRRRQKRLLTVVHSRRSQLLHRCSTVALPHSFVTSRKRWHRQGVRLARSCWDGELCWQLWFCSPPLGWCVQALPANSLTCLAQAIAESL